MADTKKFLDSEGLKIVKNDYNGKLDKKVNAETGKELYPTVDKTKLADIEENAQVNVVEKVSINGTQATIEQKEAKLTIDIPSIDGLVSESDLDEKVGGLDYIKEDDISGTYAKKTDIPTDVVKETELESKVKTFMGTVYRYKGTVDTVTDLDSKKATAEAGDTYNVNDTGANYSYVESDTNPGEGKGTWDKLSENPVDISGKADKTDLPEALSETEIKGILGIED